MNTYYGQTYSAVIPGIAPKESFFSPASTAFIIFMAITCMYIAYRWYSGRNTVPAPSYITGGFQNRGDEESFQNRTPILLNTGKPEELEDLGVTGNAKRATAFFKATTEEFTNKPFNVEGTGSFEVATSPARIQSDGFYGGAARGTGSHDCLRTSSEGSQLIDMFISKGPSTVLEGEGDLRELTQIVGKLSCFKKDLLSPSFIVDATRKQQFVTMHDIEPIAETTGRCFAKTISPRDLEIAFDKWSTRGEMLIKKLCTAYQLSPDDVDAAERLIRALIRDVKDVARSACFVGEPTIAGKPGPRDPHPYSNPDNEEFGEFTGYY